MLLLGLLLSCVEPPEEVEVPSIVAPDADGDGYSADVDCDDHDPSVRPNAPERCNGIDDDCSPTTVEATTMAMIPSVGSAEVLLCSALMVGNLRLSGGDLVLRTENGTTIRPADDRQPILDVEGGAVRVQGVNFTGPDNVGFPGESLLRVSGGHLHLRHVGLHRGQSTSGSGILARAGAHVILESSQVLDNATIGKGGGIYVEDGVLEVLDSEFAGNFAQDHGGAILALRSDVTLVGTHLLENVTDGDGGAVHLEQSTLHASKVHFEINHAADRGGALHAHKSEVSVVDSTFTNNGSADGGGAMSAVDSTVRLEAVDFFRNYSGPEGFGGALYASGSTLQGDWVRLRQNQSLPRGSGGAVHLRQGSAVDARSWMFVDNVAGDRGGAVDVVGSYFTGDESTLMVGNTALSGGALAVSGGHVRTGTLTRNAARRGGGAWLGGGQPPPVLEARVVDNKAVDGGGGLFVMAAAARFDGPLRGNVATDGDGGGVWLDAGSQLMGSIDWGDASHDNAPDDLASPWTSWSSDAAGEWTCDQDGCE